MTGALPELLFSEDRIAARIKEIAASIAASPVRPDIVAPVLVGALVFAADLMRALAHQGIHPGIEMLWLNSYGDGHSAKEISVLHAPGEKVRGHHVLIADGVLDSGRTAQKAATLLREAGAASVRIAVAVDKSRVDAVAKADFACFNDVPEFIVGYGMDDAGRWRALPYIGFVRTA
ncbi:MAG TPA: phosphoribosyltransferase family protein [Rhizomicrobium sp.]